MYLMCHGCVQWRYFGLLDWAAFMPFGAVLTLWILSFVIGGVVYGMVLVKAQATTQKGIAMRLLITISLALLMSATVSFSEEIRAECTVLVSYSVTGADAVVEHYPEAIGKSRFIQYDERKLLYRWRDYVDEYKFTKKDFNSKTFIRSIGIGASGKMDNLGTYVITLENWDCDSLGGQRNMRQVTTLGDMVGVTMASCPCTD